MSPVKLKVCGITSLADARAAIAVGAEYLGFNFYRKSPRYLTPDAARAIIAQLPEDVLTVGIFVNEAQPQDVLASLQAANVQLAQLHGDEDPAYCAAVGAERVIKALRVGDGFEARQVLDYPARAILLDAFDKNLYGGTGKTANWDVAREVAQLVPLFLAGGLSPDNIAAAICAVQPFAVDVNSGVERAPGHKDPDKLRQLKQEMETL
ncbi:MAG: phosphoribosylanthranilate isomerase [Acidobacteria bacterium]|nr:phosphoribosylanthranilate isomerase [Acidobacteriota bacterium]